MYGNYFFFGRGPWRWRSRFFASPERCLPTHSVNVPADVWDQVVDFLRRAVYGYPRSALIGRAEAMRILGRMEAAGGSGVVTGLTGQEADDLRRIVALLTSV